MGKQPDDSEEQDQSSLVSPKYTTGEIEATGTLQSVKTEIEKRVNQALGYLVSTVLGALVFALWNVYGTVNELKGKYSSPESFIETIQGRLRVLEKTNEELREKNHRLEMEKLQEEIRNLKSKKTK